MWAEKQQIRCSVPKMFLNLWNKLSLIWPVYAIPANTWFDRKKTFTRITFPKYTKLSECLLSTFVKQKSTYRKKTRYKTPDKTPVYYRLLSHDCFLTGQSPIYLQQGVTIFTCFFLIFRVVCFKKSWIRYDMWFIFPENESVNGQTAKSVIWMALVQDSRKVFSDRSWTKKKFLKQQILHLPVSTSEAANHFI